MAVYFVLYQNEGFCLKRAAKLKNKRKNAKERKQTGIERAVLRAAKFYIYIYSQIGLHRQHRDLKSSLSDELALKAKTKHKSITFS